MYSYCYGHDGNTNWGAPCEHDIACIGISHSHGHNGLLNGQFGYGANHLVAKRDTLDFRAVRDNVGDRAFVAENEWIQIVVTYDKQLSGNLQIYVNGVMKDELGNVAPYLNERDGGWAGPTVPAEYRTTGKNVQVSELQLYPVQTAFLD
jgi:hypothetical protein